MRSMNTRITLPAWWKHGVAGRRARSRLADRVATGLLWTLALAVVVMLTYVILYLLLRGLNVLSWRFIATANANQDTVGPEVFNTFYIVVLALMICLPFAMGAAIYLVEYARAPRFVRLVRFATETLAGIPSIILALFGFLFFVTQFGHGTRFGFSRLAGALTLVILNLPLLLRVTEDALRSVPNDLREASVALGANKLQTVFKTLIPASLPSLTTGVILTAGKMIGETAALIYTAGSNSGGSSGWFSLNPLLPGDTLSVHIFFLTAENPTASAALASKATSALLIILLLTFNLGFRYLAEALNRRLRGQEAARRRMGWLAWLSSR